MTAIASMRLLLVSLSFTFTVTASQHFYDPTTRDYAEACSEMAEFAGDSFCRVFEICCRDRANNKLNGDRCQLTDPTNGCQLTLEGSVEFLRCRAYNCTPEVTTTTSTTTTTASPVPFMNSSSSSINTTAALIIATALTAIFCFNFRH